jgi:deazaflavin-dependent oxidoreductase (nitroreductase family)
MLADPAVQAALTTDRTIDLTTTGRRSGRPRRIEIWFLNIDGELYIIGSPGPRHWLANLRADPRLVFHLKESTTADLAGVAHEVLDPAERRRVAEHDAASWYRGRASVAELVDRAPMVRVELTGSL